MNWFVFLVGVLSSISLQASDYRFDFNTFERSIGSGRLNGWHVHWHITKDDMLKQLKESYPQFRYTYEIEQIKPPYSEQMNFKAYEIKIYDWIDKKRVNNRLYTFYLTDPENCMVCQDSSSETKNRTREAS